VDIGKLRHRVQIQSSTDAQDGYGEQQKIWATEENVFASIEPIRGREWLEAQQVNLELTHRIIIRHTTNATAKNRIKFGDRIFDIAAPPINIEEKNIYQELLCKEKVIV
jgi:SPP1 family predicted phage head-tail adaptor